MFFRSLFYERTVLSLLEKVEQLPLHLQAEIATRVGNYINQAKTAGDETPLDRFAAAAKRQREKLASAADNPTLEQWAGPALAEAWCTAELGLEDGSLDRHSAVTIIVAIEAFALKRSGDKT
jgi:hypothetical protein